MNHASVVTIAKADKLMTYMLCLVEDCYSLQHSAPKATSLGHVGEMCPTRAAHSDRVWAFHILGQPPEALLLAPQQLLLQLLIADKA